MEKYEVSGIMHHVVAYVSAQTGKAALGTCEEEIEVICMARTPVEAAEIFYGRFKAYPSYVDGEPVQVCEGCEKILMQPDVVSWDDEGNQFCSVCSGIIPKATA